MWSRSHPPFMPPCASSLALVLALALVMAVVVMLVLVLALAVLALAAMATGERLVVATHSACVAVRASCRTLVRSVRLATASRHPLPFLTHSRFV